MDETIILQQMAAEREKANASQFQKQKELIKSRNTKDAIYFDFSYMALKLLGKNLYNNPWTAISELVANGVDAKASEVYIYFDISDKSHSTVEIIDNGIGMNYDDLADKYVWIGRNKREDNMFSEEEKQNIMGRKGIGKLAALYLTEKYYIISKKKEELEPSSWSLNMQIYRDSDLPKLDRVNNNVQLNSNAIWKNFSQGTAIKLVDIDLKRFGNRRIEGLKRTLSDFYLSSVTSKIYICVIERKNQKIVFEPIEKNIAFKNFYAMFDNSGLNISSRMSDAIEFTWLSEYPEIGKQPRPTVLVDPKNLITRGKQVFHDTCGNEIEKQYELTGWIGIHSTIETKNAVDKNFVRNDAYHPNRLRVYVRKKLAVSNYFDMRISTQTMANYIEGEISFDILDDNDLPDIATSSRQDFLEDERVALLKNLVDPIVGALFKARNQVGNEIRLEDKAYKQKLEDEKNERLRLEEEARKRAEAEIQEANEARRVAEEKFQQAQEDINVRAKQAYFLEGALTVDTRTSSYNTHVIKCNAEDIERHLKSLIKHHSSLGADEDIKAIAFALNKIIMTSREFSRINYDFKRSMERDDLGKFIEQYFNSIQEPSLKIEIRNSSRSMMDFPFQDVTMALYNVVSNSIKANASKLIVLMDNEDNSLVIRFIDDGNGIKSNIDLNTLFDFGISYTRGTGVGLAQIKDLVVNDLHGQVCIKRNEYKGTTLEIKVPYEN